LLEHRSLIAVTSRKRMCGVLDGTFDVAVALVVLRNIRSRSFRAILVVPWARYSNL
jgi:hypothetical protein